MPRIMGKRYLALAAVALAMTLAGCASRQPATSPSAPTTTWLPWTAAIGKLVADGGKPCTAILVAPSVILTASHCLNQGASPVDPRDLHFLANFGASPQLPAADGTTLRAQGGAIHEGHLNQPEQVAADWALVGIDQAPANVRPLPLLQLSTAQIRQRVATGSTLYTAGYGYGSMKVLKQHTACEVAQPINEGQIFATGILVTNCIIRVGDSGGPVVLLDQAGVPSLIGIFSGFDTKRGLSYAVNAGLIAPHLGAPLISALPLSPQMAISLAYQVFAADRPDEPLASGHGRD